MELPYEIQALLAAAIAFLVTQGLKSLSNLLGSDISGIGAAVTASLVGVVVMFANTLLALIPPEAQPSVQAAFGLLVALLGAFGLHKTIRGKVGK